jgi:hypothetical protein
MRVAEKLDWKGLNTRAPLDYTADFETAYSVYFNEPFLFY